ncbi:hypothetical protein PDESU_00633 [Pontiella desulfatans]|uniref:Lipocalin-like domain-containing protein n=1 Tax=Pontiella desulfatans TaxID=2750659 RepID=A0A6C2TWV3_PONDE|nr:hypothetical protein [Pontiella desulfatans]VGO12083.1 hypothetical protein PDESU_00633 [Pontiella desulfatans]
MKIRGISKRILLMLVGFCLLGLLAGCGGDDDGGGGGSSGDGSALVGTWKYTEDASEGRYAVFTFNSGGSYDYEAYAYHNLIMGGSGTWVVNGNKLILDGFDEATYSISGDTLTIVYSDSGDSMVWKRQ